jgi:SAM-dependent methyltransferase
MAVEIDDIGFSFVVDEDPMFAYQGWHLAHSIIERLHAAPSSIFVQFTAQVDLRTVDIFKSLGCTTTRIKRFGDGKYCNKLAQWNAELRASHFKQFIFLDTDTIFVGNCLDELRSDVIGAKIVDLANPPIDILEELMHAAGFGELPSVCRVDASEELTYFANSNGGFYSIPRQFAEVLFESWRRWALWLLDHSEPLRKADKTAHIDQVSFCMAVHETGLPFQFIPSNLNYFVHFAGRRHYYDPAKPISLLHYHNQSVNVVGLLEPAWTVTPAEKQAIEQANSQIARHFENKLFWEMRYANFSERGSGVGSRGENLDYKRRLLIEQGAEQARSVLDVGCGDLEVVKALDLSGYVGIDQSMKTLEIAKRARPDWSFRQAPCPDAAPADFVLCFEVLIHQESLTGYNELIRYLAAKTRRVLLVSGYEEATEAIRANSMLFFYEPLSRSLMKTEKFISVKAVGRHTDVTIFRCEVRPPTLGRLLRRSLRRRP